MSAPHLGALPIFPFEGCPIDRTLAEAPLGVLQIELLKRQFGLSRITQGGMLHGVDVLLILGPFRLVVYGLGILVVFRTHLVFGFGLLLAPCNEGHLVFLVI